MNDNLHQRLAQFSSLDCEVARRFSDRPTLLESAEQLLLERWQAHYPGSPHDPLQLFLDSRHPHTDHAWIRPLAQVLVERYCQRSTLNLNDGADFLTTRLDSDPSGQVVIDLHEAELLINETGPLLLEAYQQQLIGYWRRFDQQGETPWRWYANYLHDQFQQAIASCAKDSSWPQFALTTARLVHAYPLAATRSHWQNTRGLTVTGLAANFSADGDLDVDLASAVLIEHRDLDPERNLTLLYTLSGKLLRFESRQSVLNAIRRYRNANSPLTPYTIELDFQFPSAFENQALGLLQQQLQLIEQIAANAQNKLDAITLSLDLDRFTSLIDLCNETEAAQRRSLSTQLPEWLRNAKGRPLMRYSTLLVDVAQRYHDARGRFWLDDVPDAETFANQQLAARFAADHPGTTCTPEQVRVTNYQVTAAALPGQGGIVMSGEENPLDFTLAQLAIGNLGLLKPGRITLASTTDTPLPAWMNEHYLRAVISNLDIGSTYPALLRRMLLTDVSQREERQRLLMAQLRAQLPALAMELHLQGKVDDAQAPEHISQALGRQPGVDASQWTIRQLGFIKSPGADADYPRNTWLIEPLSPSAQSCLLYRPLHQDSLLYFHDRLALFVAISTPGALQDDLLYRLPAEDRRFYAHGGFLEPHLFFPIDDPASVPFGKPPAVILALDPPPVDLGQALYLACVNESIARFEERSASTAQTRWEHWKTLGWLLFNTLLPLAGSTLGKVAWLAQMEVALAEFVETEPVRDPTRHELAMIDLLVNIAMLLFSHSLMRLRLEQESILPTATLPVDPSTPATEPEPASTELVTRQNFNFSWSTPDRTLNAEQQGNLDKLQANLTLSQLGTPAPIGPFQGLYLHDSRFYAVLAHERHPVVDGKIIRVTTRQAYEVRHDSERQQMRIIGPDQTPGPWLRQDELGRWALDLGLYYKGKGGMPITEHMERMRLQRQNALEAADALISADKAAFDSKAREMTTLEKLVAATRDDKTLSTCQDKLSQLATFWLNHLEHLKSRNALAPMKNFRMAQAAALRQESFCQLVLHKLLKQRFDPHRTQLSQLVEQHQRGQPLDEADTRITTQRLEQQAQLLERMLENNARLRHTHDALARLAGPRFEQIVKWRDLAASVPANAKTELILRFLQAENLVNQLTLLHDLSLEAAFWLDRTWDNLQLGIAQRLSVLAQPQVDAEANVRLLQSISERLQTSQRQLQILLDLTADAGTPDTIRQLQVGVEHLLRDVARDLAELPDYPPVSTLGQLRHRLPGLIETAEHGVLLAKPRPDDATTVDLPGPETHTPGRTYQLRQGSWVELKPVKAAPGSTGRSLKRLLKESAALMARTREEVASVRRAGNRYLPVEIEESVLHQRARLLNQVEAIEARLTADNATDEGIQGLDAEGTARTLRAEAEALQEQATRLRLEAALAQKPRMAEVQFLIEQGQVQLARVGTRVRLARVKGRPVDFLDEYSISHNGQVLWYAHFHYAAQEAAKVDFTAGHLKTLAQRHAAGQQVTEANGSVSEVYRAPITTAAASAHFFNL
ncbi:hypothetical protein [Pantoea sp. Cy-639]|uniref:hypothetical protein n=1 Tax=Pantoea sp. Cy-639 TaxID=2608360 RepID=UPI00142252D0|nr:hypothetical protein [Pantoea sp. Cy-639]NIF18388.1 hypothetical protein [Pantoea sp. Cy-639]